MQRSMMLCLVLGACASSTKTVPVNVRVDVGGEVSESVEQIEVGPDDGAEYGMIGLTPGGQSVLMRVNKDVQRVREIAANLPICGWDKEKIFLDGLGGNRAGYTHVCFNSTDSSLSRSCVLTEVAQVSDVEEQTACQLYMTEELVEWSKLQECSSEARQLGIGHANLEAGTMLLIGYNGDGKGHEHHVSPVYRDEPFPPLGSWGSSCLMRVNEGDLTVASLLRALSAADSPSQQQ